MFGIPCVGFGPAEESVAHTVEDRVPIEHLTRCAAFYAAFPGTYCGQPAARAPQGGRSSARAGK
jgi:acetylornithine deacetylase/succinyl-diaminopimelate desuccinylase-like protein